MGIFHAMVKFPYVGLKGKLSACDYPKVNVIYYRSIWMRGGGEGLPTHG